MDDNLMVGDPSGAPVVDDNNGGVQPTHQEAPAPSEPTAPLILDNNEIYADGIPVQGEEAPVGPVVEPPVVEEPVAPAPVEQPPTPAPEPIAKPEEPTNNYGFDVTLADGTTLRINSPEDIKQLDKDVDFGTPANFLEMQANYTKMVNGLEADKKKFEEESKAFESQEQARQAEEQQIQTLVSEIDYLVAKGLLPKPDDKFSNADWSKDAEAQKDAGVKEQLALIDYRIKENEARAKAGLPPMGIVDAYNQRKIEMFEQQQTEEKTRRNDLTKAKGSMVHEPSPAPQNNIPDDMMVGEGGDVRSITPSFLS